MSSSNNPFRGVVAPLLTPLTSTGDLDCPALGRYLDFLLDNGVDGLFVLSSTGEFCAMPWPKQVALVEATLRHVNGRAPVCAGVSTQCLEDSICRARQMSDLGVDGVVALPPFYFRTSQAEMLAFFRAIADHSAAPLLVYNMPFRTQHNIEVETVLALREHGNIIGLKDSVGDRERTQTLARELAGQGSRFCYLHGNELLMLEAAAWGAHGCIASVANFAPRFISDALEHALAGEVRHGDQEKVSALMASFGLFESRPQESTTLRLMALKAILQAMGIMQSHMAQLGPSEMPVEWMERAREFVARHQLHP